MLYLHPLMGRVASLILLVEVLEQEDTLCMCQICKVGSDKKEYLQDFPDQLFDIYHILRQKHYGKEVEFQKVHA